MAAGRPALMVGPEASEPGETIQISNAGRVIDPVQREAEQRLHDTLLELYQDPDLRAKLGKNGRTVFLKHFEREVACQRWSDLLENLLGENGTSSPVESGRSRTDAVQRPH
jgi:glycosyltransferase involved in cell wall biosynthesis